MECADCTPYVIGFIVLVVGIFVGLYVSDWVGKVNRKLKLITTLDEHCARNGAVGRTNTRIDDTNGRLARLYDHLGLQEMEVPSQPSHFKIVKRKKPKGGHR